MGGQRVQQCFVVLRIQLQFAVERFFAAQEIAHRQAAAGDERGEGVAAQGGLQVVDDVRLDAVFAQEGEGAARGGAARVVIEGDGHEGLRLKR